MKQDQPASPPGLEGVKAMLESATEALSRRAEEYYITFAEVVEVAWVRERWLRSLMERKGNLDLGKKNKSGQWLFDHSDVYDIAIIYALNSSAKLPPSLAKTISDKVAEIVKNTSVEDTPEVLNICFLEDGTPLVWDASLKSEQNIKALAALGAHRLAHISLPFGDIVDGVHKNLLKQELRRQIEAGDL